jgi:hypothetical protein
MRPIDSRKETGVSTHGHEEESNEEKVEESEEVISPSHLFAII